MITNDQMIAQTLATMQRLNDQIELNLNILSAGFIVFIQYSYLLEHQNQFHLFQLRELYELIVSRCLKYRNLAVYEQLGRVSSLNPRVIRCAYNLIMIICSDCDLFDYSNFAYLQVLEQSFGH